MRDSIHASYISNELVGIFEDGQQVTDAAELYGITLVSYENRVALFKCEGDPKELINSGIKNGWPRLSLNFFYKAF